MAGRLSIMYGALFLLFGVQLPYLPVWLDWVGLSAGQIALVLAMSMLLRIAFVPLVGYWADWSGDAVAVARVLALGTLAFTTGLVLGGNEWSIVIPVVGMMIFGPSLNPLTETLTMAAVRRGEVEYGSIRLWGSLTFIFANLGAGLIIDWSGAGSISWMLLAGCIFTVIAFHLVPRATAEGQPAGPALRAVSLTTLQNLLCSRKFLLLLVVGGLLQASHAVFYVYGVLHWRSLGYTTTVVGTLWAIGVIAEIALFRAGRRILDLLGAIGLLLVGGAAGIFRWGIMALDPILPVLLLLQVAHALTYAAAHMGTMHLIARIVPQELAGSAQALLSVFTASVAMSGAMLIAGLLYSSVGGLSYGAMAGISAIGLALAVWLGRVIAQEDSC